MRHLNRTNQSYHEQHQATPPPQQQPMRPPQHQQGAAAGGWGGASRPAHGMATPQAAQPKKGTPGGGTQKPRNRATAVNVPDWAPLAQSKRTYPDERMGPSVVGVPCACLSLDRFFCCQHDVNSSRECSTLTSESKGLCCVSNCALFMPRPSYELDLSCLTCCGHCRNCRCQNQKRHRKSPCRTLRIETSISVMSCALRARGT